MQAQLLSYKCPHCGHPTDVDAAMAEQTIACPNPLCHKPFKLEVPTAAPTPNLVISPGLAHEVAEENAANPAKAPSEIEAELIDVHPLLFRRYPFRGVTYALLSIVGVGLLCSGVVKGVWWLGLLGIAMVGFGLYRLGGWWLRMIGTSVTVTTKRTLLRSGFFHGQLTEIPHAEVAEIEVHQNLLNRLMGVGDIALVHHTTDRRGILLMGLPNPEDIAHQIRTRREG
jgi:hypothetical protein